MSRQEAPREQGATPYVDALVVLRDERAPTRLMVPGHKGGQAIPTAFERALGKSAAAVLGLDIPQHVRDVDVPPPYSTDPTAFDRALKLAADAWDAHTTHFVVGGASQANHTVCLALALMARARPRVAVQRNVHLSVIYGLMLADAEVFWLKPELDAKFGVYHCVTATHLNEVLAAEGPFDGVIVVSPTYHGAVCDVPALSEVARAHQATLVVDEAWGAHFPFHSRFPDSAVTCGADIVVSSTHKHLGSLTQSAMLHVTKGSSEALAQFVEAAISKAARLVRTTSPSSLLLASLDAARAFACGDGGERLGRAAANADRVRDWARALANVEVVDGSIVARTPGVVDFDPLRVTLDVRQTGHTGCDVRDLLWQATLQPRGIEIEFCTHELVVAVFGVGDDSSDSADHLIEALTLVFRQLRRKRAPQTPRPVLPDFPTSNLSLRAGFLDTSVPIELESSEDRVCAEVIAPYPPGISIVLPGEILTKSVVEYLLSVRDGAQFPDCADDTLRKIQVLVPTGASAN
jgi:arginine decarboxylase